MNLWLSIRTSAYEINTQQAFQTTEILWIWGAIQKDLVDQKKNVGVGQREMGVLELLSLRGGWLLGQDSKRPNNNGLLRVGNLATPSVLHELSRRHMAAMASTHNSHLPFLHSIKHTGDRPVAGDPGEVRWGACAAKLDAGSHSGSQTGRFVASYALEAWH